MGGLWGVDFCFSIFAFAWVGGVCGRVWGLLELFWLRTIFAVVVWVGSILFVGFVKGFGVGFVLGLMGGFALCL